MKKNILFMIDALTSGGAEKVLLDLVNHLDKDKYSITLMTLADVGSLKERIPNDIIYKSVFKNKLIYLIVMLLPAKILYKLFIKEEYDIEVAFVEGRSTKVISGSKNSKSKKIAWLHIDLINNHWTKPYFRGLNDERKCYSKFDKIICVSNEVKDAFISMFGIRKNVFFKQNIINDMEIRKKANRDFDNCYKKNRFSIITIGRLNHQKGYDRLLKIVKRLNSEGIQFDLYILGEGNEKTSLEKYINENNLSNVKLLGFNQNPYPYLKNADLFVSSSRSEGFSTVVSEAIILGIPIVTTNCAGMKELLGDNEYGIITENNSDALYEGIKNIILNKDIYDSYKEKVLLRSKDFNLSNLLQEIEKLF